MISEKGAGELHRVIGNRNDDYMEQDQFYDQIDIALVFHGG